eukprot:scaffold9312_cov19-Tisochrysis_lutea.AAC.1
MGCNIATTTVFCDYAFCLQIEGVRWEPYPIFVAVAERGGADAVTAAGLWREVAGAWSPKLAECRAYKLHEVRVCMLHVCVVVVVVVGLRCPFCLCLHFSVYNRQEVASATFHLRQLSRDAERIQAAAAAVRELRVAQNTHCQEGEA